MRRRTLNKLSTTQLSTEDRFRLRCARLRELLHGRGGLLLRCARRALLRRLVGPVCASNSSSWASAPARHHSRAQQVGGRADALSDLALRIGLRELRGRLLLRPHLDVDLHLRDSECTSNLVRRVLGEQEGVLRGRSPPSSSSLSSSSVSETTLVNSSFTVSAARCAADVC